MRRPFPLRTRRPRHTVPPTGFAGALERRLRRPTAPLRRSRKAESSPIATVGCSIERSRRPEPAPPQRKVQAGTRRVTPQVIRCTESNSFAFPSPRHSTLFIGGRPSAASFRRRSARTLTPSINRGPGRRRRSAGDIAKHPTLLHGRNLRPADSTHNLSGLACAAFHVDHDNHVRVPLDNFLGADAEMRLWQVVCDVDPTRPAKSRRPRKSSRPPS